MPTGTGEILGSRAGSHQPAIAICLLCRGGGRAEAIALYNNAAGLLQAKFAFLYDPPWCSWLVDSPAAAAGFLRTCDELQARGKTLHRVALAFAGKGHDGVSALTWNARRAEGWPRPDCWMPCLLAAWPRRTTLSNKLPTRTCRTLKHGLEHPIWPSCSHKCGSSAMWPPGMKRVLTSGQRHVHPGQPWATGATIGPSAGVCKGSVRVHDHPRRVPIAVSRVAGLGAVCPVPQQDTA